MSVTTQTAVLAGRHVRRFFRAPPALIYSFAFPVLLMLTQLTVFGDVVGPAAGGRYIDRLAPLVVLATAAYGAASSAVGFLRDVRGGFIARIRTMPVNPAALLLGRLAGDVIRILAVAVLTTGVAYLVGFRFTQGIPAALAFFGVTALAGLMWASISLLLGIAGGTEEGVQASLTGPATLLFIFSSGFVPLTAFPGVVQPLVRANPLSVTTDALIGLSHGGPVARPVLYTLIWTAAVALVCLPLVWRRFAALAS
jgi:ABC transporter DrrB family efflux protein